MARSHRDAPAGYCVATRAAHRGAGNDGTIAKAEVDRSIESRRAAARFEPDAALPADPSAIEAAEARPTRAGTPAPAAPKTEAETEEDDYPTRLLKAKKQVWRDRGQDRGVDPDATDEKK